MAKVTALPNYQRSVPRRVFFDRKELNKILNVYGTMVIAGKWRDYAIDGGKDQAAFSIFRRASEMPLYRIVKRPEWEHKQGAYAVLSPSGEILKRGKDLDQLLRYFDRKKLKLVK